MSRARTALRFVSACSFLFLAATASAQAPASFGSGSMLGNKPQDDAAVAPAPAASRLGSLITGDALTLRRWWLEFSARPATRGAVVRSAPAQRQLLKRDHVWVR